MINFKIKGLDCAACALELEEKIQKVEGVMEKIRKVIKKEEPDVTIEKI